MVSCWVTALPSAALAQPEGAPPTPAAVSASAPERVVITGSNVRRIDAETTLPVQIISAEEIARSGKSSVTEILSTLTINGANGVTDNASFGNFAYGASGISLRGLGPTAVLVLINGRRIAPYSVPDIGKGLTNFVNVDSIPKAAIQRIEVLKDGASAIYGSDAMAGVVNIILRSDFTGGQVGAEAHSTGGGDYRTRSANFSYGLGDLGSDGYNTFFSFEAYERDAVYLRDVKDEVIDPRHRDSSFYYTGRPYTQSYSPYPNYYSGVTVDPATGTAFVATPTGQASSRCPASNSWAFNGNFTPPLALCGYDYWGGNQYVTPLERQSLFTRGELKLGGDLSGFGELSFTRTRNTQTDWPVPFGSGRSATPDGRDGGVSFVPNYLPAGHPNNPFPDQDTGIRYLFTDVGPQITDAENRALRALAGLKGRLGNWDWETALLYARDQATITYGNRVSLPVLRDAVLNGTYDFENPAGGAITAADLRITPRDHGVSSFTQIDGKATSEIFDLPGGAAGLALGAELRRETRRYTPDPRIFAGEVYLQVAGQTEGSRNVATVYSELVMPVLKSVELQLAVRADRYSDYGSSTTPKLAGGWTPTSWLKLRGSLTKGFRAPSLNEISSSNTPFFNFVDFDPKRCGTYNVDCDGYQNSGTAIANRDVKAETSLSHSLGFVLEPMQDLTAAVDFWSIDRKNEIVYLDQAELIDNEDSTSPLYAGRVVRLPDDTVSVPGQTIPGRIATVQLQFLNRGRTQVQGVDLDVRKLVRLGEYGRLTLGAMGTRTSKFRTRTDDASDWVEYAGTLDYPRWRAESSVTWEGKLWSAGATLRYLSGFKSTIPGQDCTGTRFLGSCEVDHFLTGDLWVSYEGIKGLTLNANVRNVTDKRMPFVPVYPTGDRDLYSPSGRLFGLSADYRF